MMNQFSKLWLSSRATGPSLPLSTPWCSPHLPCTFKPDYGPNIASFRQNTNPGSTCCEQRSARFQLRKVRTGTCRRFRRVGPELSQPRNLPRKMSSSILHAPSTTGESKSMRNVTLNSNMISNFACFDDLGHRIPQVV